MTATNLTPPSPPQFNDLIEFQIGERHVNKQYLKTFCKCKFGYTFHRGRMDKNGVVWEFKPGFLGHPNCLEGPTLLKDLMEMIKG